MSSTKTKLHAEIASALIPSIGEWHMHAGGTGSPDKHGYTLHPPEGSYYIDPVSNQHGRHIGYVCRFAATGGKGAGANRHSGLWHDIGMFKTPASAVKAAKIFHASAFK